MSVAAAYEVHIDLDNDLTFESGDENVSDYQAGMSWSLGMRTPWDNVARAATLTLTLTNSDGRFSPEHGSALSGFTPGRAIRVRTVYSSTTRQHYIGWIDPDGISPSVGQYGQRVCQVQASGYLIRVQDEPVFLAVHEGARTDEILAALIEASGVYPPGHVGWLLGNLLYSVLGMTSYLATGVSNYSDMEQGKTMPSYAGDNWKINTSVYTAIKEVMDAEGEGALFWIDEMGKVRFVNRHYMHSTTSVDAVLSDANLLIRGKQTYNYGYIENDIRLTFHPRTVGSSPTTLATVSNRIRANGGESTVQRVRLDDGSGNTIGGKTMSVTSLSATSNEDGSGDDLSSNISTSLVEGGNAAEVTIVNSGSRTAYVKFNIQGIKITDYGEQNIHVTDDSSILAYGYQRQKIDLPLLDNRLVAVDFALGRLNRRKNPSGIFESITILANYSDAAMIQALTRTIGDRITLSESQTGGSGDYFIVGVQHKVVNKYDHTVTFVLSPAPTEVFWQIGTSTLGVNTYLGW